MLAPMIWFAIGVALFLAELFSPVFVMAFFGLGAWAAGLASLMQDSLVVSLTTFCIVSVASLVLLRATLVKTFRGNFRPAPSGTEAEAGRPLYAGRLASVTPPLEPGVIGEIAFGGSFWRAVADTTIPAGATVRILSSLPDDDLTFHVERVSA